MESSLAPAASDSRPAIQALEDQITLLTGLNSSVQNLRKATTYLQPTDITTGLSSGGGVLPIYQTPPLQQGFVQLKALSESVQSEAIQRALKAAKESATKDYIGLSLGGRRRQPPKRPLTPELPQSFRSLRPEKLSLFPPENEPANSPLRLHDLIEYVKDYNKTNRFLLQIWASTTRNPGHLLAEPTVVRFLIPDTLTFYITLGTMGPDSKIIVESATAFGSREKKPPHAQSDFIVFQRLSQHLAKMLQSKPQVSFQLLVQLLASYEDLFVRPCMTCQRVITTEGHIPPVARTWSGASHEAGQSDWHAKHPVCI